MVGWLIVPLYVAGGTYAAYVMVTRGHPDAHAVFGTWTQDWCWYLLLALAVIYVPLFFPDWRLLSRR